MAGHILIVDDHEAVRRGLRSLLSGQDWEICGEAADGREAVEKAKSLRPDLVIMDISMPHMNGLDATRLIRQELPASCVIIISQNDPATAQRQAEKAGAFAFIPKTALAQHLLPTISKVKRQSEPAAAPVAPPAIVSDWLSGGGELARLIREYDWSQTPLGPIGGWPQSLKTSVNLILNSQHPMWLGWGPRITFLYNDAYIQVLSSAKHPSALGKPTAEVWGEIWDYCGPLAERVFSRGEASFIDEIRLIMNRGDFLEETYYSFSYSPIRDESGAVAGLFCPSTEVTPKVINARRLRTLAELSASALLQKTTEAACKAVAETLAENPDDVPFAALYLIDPESKVARLERTCRLTPGIEHITPQSIALTPAAKSPHCWPFAEVVSSGKPQVVSVADVEGLPLGVGEQHVAKAIVLPVTSRSEEGTIGVLIAGISPAQKLNAEYTTFYELIAGQIATAIQNARSGEEERKRHEALAEIDRAKTAFFSNVSHEFRTPLTLMLGPVEDLLATSHTGLSPAAKSQLELVSRNGSRLLRLVNTLLDFSRIEAGRMQALYQATDLSAFTIELASVFRSATERAGLGLQINCPSLNEPVFVDRNMWEKIVLNLISNAFKFTFDGAITVSLAKVEQNVELRVQDTGIGIPSHELPRLFDRFHRIENTRSRTHEGSGIGLALVQELVKLQGGSVGVESVPELGTTFIVSLPLGSAHLPADRIAGPRTLASTALGAAPFVEEALRWLPENAHDAEIEAPPTDDLIPVPCPPLNTADAAGQKRPVIVVADDNADMRQYLVRLLGERYEVRAVPDGQAALEAIQKNRPDLVLTDVMMPNLDGFGLLQQLRSNPETVTIPIILLSARAGEESRVEGMEHGADDYLIKPFSARELLARVQTHLQMARMRKQAENTLRQHRERFDLVVEAAQVGFWFCDLPFDKLVWDKRVKEHFWLPPDADVTIDTFYQRLHPDDRERTRRSIDESAANHSLYDIEYRTVSLDGREKWIRALGHTFYDAADNPVRFDGLTLEITERKHNEERERQMTAQSVAATAKFRAVFDQTPVFAGIVALDGTLIDANQLSLEFCGYRAEDQLGRPFWKAGWWHGSIELQKTIKAATMQAAKGIPFRQTITYYWADDSERLIDFSIHPILDPEGRILFLHPNGVDITDLKRAEENYKNLAESLDAEVRIRTAEVVQQSEQLRDLSSRLLQAQDEERRRVARELHDSAGQLLTALGINLSQVVKKIPAADARSVQFLQESQQFVQQLSQEIRTMSYLLHPPLLDEAGLPEALRWYIDGLSERSAIKVNLEIAANYERPPREMELVMFRLVQECLTNIHRHSGSKSAVIRIGSDQDCVTLDVQDAGQGIPKEKLARLQSHGSGVGLRGMRERARQFGGDMRIKSDDAGTTISFRFHLPAEQTQKADGAAQGNESQQLHASSSSDH